MLVLGGVGMRLSELLLILLPYRVHVLGTSLADGHGAMHRRGWRGGGGWRRIIDYHVHHRVGGSRSMRLRLMVTGTKEHNVYPGSDPLDGGKTVLSA